MKICGVGLALVVCVSLCACVLAPPSSTEPQPMLTVDTSWKVGKGFDLNEAKALIEFCTALDYGKACLQIRRDERTES